MSYGAAGGLAIDVDERSLDSARRTLAPYPTVQVARRSAYDINRQGEFDLAFSIGVIHHLADPDRALTNIVGAVKPGGRILIWVYGLENNRWIVSLLDLLRKVLFSRFTIRLVHHFSLCPPPYCG